MKGLAIWSGGQSSDSTLRVQVNKPKIIMNHPSSSGSGDGEKSKDSVEVDATTRASNLLVYGSGKGKLSMSGGRREVNRGRGNYLSYNDVRNTHSRTNDTTYITLTLTQTTANFKPL